MSETTTPTRTQEIVVDLRAWVNDAERANSKALAQVAGQHEPGTTSLLVAIEALATTAAQSMVAQQVSEILDGGQLISNEERISAVMKAQRSRPAVGRLLPAGAAATIAASEAWRTVHHICASDS